MRISTLMASAIGIGGLGYGWEIPNHYHGGKREMINRLSQNARRKRAKWGKK